MTVELVAFGFVALLVMSAFIGMIAITIPMWKDSWLNGLMLTFIDLLLLGLLVCCIIIWVTP